MENENKKENVRNKGKYLETDFPTFRSRIQELKSKEPSLKVFLKKIKTCEKTYMNWINGKNEGDGLRYILPSASKLLYIAKVYDCSVDYVLGISDYTSVTNDYIGNTTGLIDIAIHNLELDNNEIKNYKSSSTHYVDIINFLLCNRDGAKLLCTLYRYLFGNFTTTETGETQINLRDASGIPTNGGTIAVKNLNAMFLSMLMEQVAQIKQRISEEPGYSLYGKYSPNTGTDELSQLLASIPPILD